MARYSGGDGMTKVVFALSIADISAPSIGSELDSAEDWTGFILKDGLAEPSDQNNMDLATLLDTFDGQGPGSFGGAIELTVQRDNEDDVVWDTVVYGLEGFLVVRSGIPAASSFSVGEPLRVYPGTWHEPVPVSPSGNTADQFTAMFPVSRQPDLKAVAAA